MNDQSMRLRSSRNFKELAACAFAAALAFGVWSQPAFSQSITIPKPVPFAKDNAIPGAIKRECKLDQLLSDYIAAYAKRKNIATTFADQTDSSTPGKVLVLEIRDVAARGHVMMGHMTSTLVVGQLYEDTKLV
ncbi:MAG: hypothetical protein JSS28_05930, partial [Proteobacteria bacterium]|nr:hypothetical protein [Pseudomonadota bacterium]